MTPRRFAFRLLLLVLLAAVCASAQPPSPEACRAERKRGRLPQAEACFQNLARQANPFLRAEGLWGLERFEEANNAFRAAVEAQPKNALYRLRWGYLFLERFNKAEAAKLFEEALTLDPNSAVARLALATVAAESFDRKAVELAQEALKLDPKLAAAHELLARLALEENDLAEATRQARQALQIAPESLDAMALLATTDLLQGLPDSPWFAKILALNPVYGEAYATAGNLIILNRRYEEGIALLRKALSLNPRLWSAHSQLGINLMRLGQDADARKALETAYHNGFRDAATVNTLRLLDSYKNFQFTRDARFIIKLHKKEHALLLPYVRDELLRCIAAFEKKYKTKLTRPVQLELYPDHEDFAVRTLGMPGLGALGVTFGHVVAMDSPSGRKPGSFHWASTLWHEMSHVFVLALTNHRVPRWFTEGMAVYEETAASPEWGDRLTPDIIQAVKARKLLPVAELDRGFVRPSYPNQVVVSYFQAGKICEYIASRWSYDKLLEMTADFAQLKPTPDVIRTRLSLEPVEFDKQFLAWLDRQTSRTVNGFEQWRQSMKTLLELAKAKQHDAVIQGAAAARDLYPEYVEENSPYELLADAYLARGDKKSALAALTQYRAMGGREPALLKRLASLQAESGLKKDAATTLTALNYIYLHDEAAHRQLGALLLELGNPWGAVREFSAVLALNPIDKAAAHFDLARAYHQAGRKQEATDHVVHALEAAPGFKPAQKLLLELETAK